MRYKHEFAILRIGSKPVAQLERVWELDGEVGMETHRISMSLNSSAHVVASGTAYQHIRCTKDAPPFDGKPKTGKLEDGQAEEEARYRPDSAPCCQRVAPPF